MLEPAVEADPATVMQQPGRYSISSRTARRRRGNGRHESPTLPFRHGPLVATAASLPTGMGTERHDILVDDEGRMTVVLVQTATRQMTDAVLSTLRPAIEAGKHSVLLSSQVDACVVQHQGEEGGSDRAAVALLRFSSDGENVEIVNTGLPPILCVRRNGDQLAFPGAGPRGEIVTCRHGDVFVIASPGLVGGAGSSDELDHLVERVGLARHGHCVAAAPPEDLAVLLREHVATTRADSSKDATLILVGSRSGRNIARRPLARAPRGPIAFRGGW